MLCPLPRLKLHAREQLGKVATMRGMVLWRNRTEGDEKRNSLNLFRWNCT